MAAGLGGLSASTSKEATREIKANQNFPDQDYVVVGIWNAVQSTPKEVIVPVGAPPGHSNSGQLFRQIRKAERQLRPRPRRLLSLKKVAGFDVYQCVPQLGYHVMLPIDDHSKRILADFFREYNSRADDNDDRWLRWLKEELNSNSKDPEAGRYALRLDLRWSAPKIIFWTASPVVLSLAIAFWYSYKPRALDADDVAVVQTAWTIASYIITAAALMIAGVGAVTQLGT